jgi:hypothetical protein
MSLRAIFLGDWGRLSRVPPPLSLWGCADVISTASGNWAARCQVAPLLDTVCDGFQAQLEPVSLTPCPNCRSSVLRLAFAGALAGSHSNNMNAYLVLQGMIDAGSLRSEAPGAVKIARYPLSPLSMCTETSR